LGQSVDWWNSAMIWGLALAAIAAVFVVIATRIIVTRTGQLTAAQEALGAAKDRQLALDLKAKDEKIAQVVKDTAGANERANAAEATVESAKAEAAKANLELAKIRTPRTIPRDKEAMLSAELGVFSGQEFAAYTFQDQESMDLANTVGRILLGASWKLETPESDIVIGRLGTTPISGVQIQIAAEAGGSVRSAADALARALKAGGGIDSAVDSRNPARAKTPKTIHILIGKKPM